jgi:S-DNA-T family DNA segregation ATPase FtsK/SpoIIIE
MTLSVRTEALLSLLGDLVHTTGHPSPACDGILLHTARGYFGDEPGQTTLLVGTSLNGRAIGHTYIPTLEGTLTEPMLWSTLDVGKVSGLLKASAKDKNHTVRISRDLDTCKIQEPANLFDEGDVFEFHTGKLDDYPREAWKLLNFQHPDELPLDYQGRKLLPSPRMEFATNMLAPFVAVAKAHKTNIQIYAQHQERPMLVRIGSRYRGAILPVKWSRDVVGDVAAAGRHPDGDVYDPGLPPAPKKVNDSGQNRKGPKVIQMKLPKTPPPDKPGAPEFEPAPY